MNILLSRSDTKLILSSRFWKRSKCVFQ